MKKLLLILLAGSMLLCGTTVAFAATPMFENADSRAVHLYEYPGEQGPVQLKEGSDIAQYLYVDDTFSEIQLNCPSWSNNIGSMTFKLYNWKGDYNSTVASEPIAQETFTDYADNAWLVHKAKNGSYPKGEYLWVLTDPVESVGIWKANYDNMDTTIITESYLAGEVVTGVYVCCIVYTDRVVNKVEVEADPYNVLMYVDSNKAYVRGTETTLDVPATVINGRTLVPARFVSESIGAEVLWDEESQTVTIKKGDITITLVIGSDEMKVNGQVKTLDVPAAVINYRTLVPLRAIVEALGQQANFFADGSKGLIVVGPNAVVFSKEKADKMLKLYR